MVDKKELTDMNLEDHQPDPLLGEGPLSISTYMYTKNSRGVSSLTMAMF